MRAWLFAVGLLVLLPVALPALAQSSGQGLTCGFGQTLIYFNPPGLYECVDTSGSSSSGGSSDSGSSSSSGGDSSDGGSSGGQGGESSSNTSFGGVMSTFAKWLLDVLLYIPRWIWQELLKVLGAAIAAIPVPSWFATFQQSMGSVSSMVVWWFDFFEFKAGLSMVAGALLMRFLLRRIPLIG